MLCFGWVGARGAFFFIKSQVFELCPLDVKRSRIDFDMGEESYTYNTERHATLYSLMKRGGELRLLPPSFTC